MTVLHLANYFLFSSQNRSLWIFFQPCSYTAALDEHRNKNNHNFLSGAEFVKKIFDIRFIKIDHHEFKHAYGNTAKRMFAAIVLNQYEIPLSH
jgi:hypothetical protein